MRASDIQFLSDKRSKTRAKTQSIRAKLYKVDANCILYTVTSSKGDKQYKVTIQMLDSTANRLKSLKKALQGDLRVSCTCPAFLYMGYKYITWRRGVGIDKETRSPDVTNPDRKGMGCKHIIVALDQLKKDYSEIYKLYQQQDPEEDPRNTMPELIEYNSKSSTPTEYDIVVITDFKNQCAKLYKDYNDFLKSNPPDDASFVDSKYYKKVDPSQKLKELSIPVLKSLKGKFIGKLQSLDDILNMIDLKKSGFNILLDSDVKDLLKKLNSTVYAENESYINDIILTLMYS